MSNLNQNIKKLSSLPAGWDTLLQEYVSSEAFQETIVKTAKLYEEEAIYPPIDFIYNALNYVKPEEVKVVILGQDPYINEGQANGLAFSVSQGVPLPPSLKNIFKELDLEYKIGMKTNGDLTSWAKQGVLLLNSSLVTKAHQAGSLCKIGWNDFTDEIIRAINSLDQPVVYLLWGNFAKKAKRFITSKNACVLETSHPSPLSVRHGFLGSNCFKNCNEYLVSKGLKEVDFTAIEGQTILKLFD